MSTSRTSHDFRILALATAAALVMCAPAAVLAQNGTPASAAGKSTTMTKPLAKGGETDEQKELTEHLQKMTKRLKLTDEQVPKVREIMQSKMAQMSELRAKYKGEPTTPENKVAMEKAHQELHADLEAKFAQVLTADQMIEYKKMTAEHMKKESAKEEKEEEAKEAKK